MPREAPVIRAMREARGGVIKRLYQQPSPRTRGPIRRDGYDERRRLCLFIFEPRRPVVTGPRVRGDDRSARLRQQRELPRLRLGLGLGGAVWRMGAGEAMV